MSGKVIFTRANIPKNEYVYSAAGTKLSVIHKSTTEKRTDYVGIMIYENGSLKRILVDGGYIENGVYHFYIQDHLGNNRVVAKSDGTVVQTNHYYPYGMSFAGGIFADKQPYKYNGKELDNENGLNLYDYHARQMEVCSGRFTSVDPLAEKYYAISPYVYCVDNPMRTIDLKGDSITILNLGTGKDQHMAILIQNDQGKWQYFSVNGDNVYLSGNHTGGRKFDDIAIGEWDSPQQFMDSQYNSEGDKNDEDSNSYGYSQGYIIPTTPEQDEMIRDEFTGISINESYDILLNNCATAVHRSLVAGGVKAYTTHNQPITSLLNIRKSTSAFSIGNSKGNRSNIPSVAFQSIIVHNPKGKLINKR